MTNLYSFHNLHTTATTFQVEVRFDPSHPVFAGHFPGQPIVPGAFLVEMLTEAVSGITGRQVIFKESAAIKFLQVIDPRKNPAVQIIGTIVEIEADTFKIDATFRQGELLFAKMKGMKVGI